LKILWISIIILTITIYPLYFFVFHLNEIVSIILSIITITLITAILLIVSLNHQNEENLKNSWKLIKKYLLIITLFIIIALLYFPTIYVINKIERNSYEKKEALLKKHFMDNPWAITFLKKNKNGTLRGYNDIYKNGYTQLSAWDLLITNSGNIDISNVGVHLRILNDKQETLFSKELKIECYVKAHSSHKITYFFDPNEYESIPEPFYTESWIESAEPSPFFIRHNTYAEINQLLKSDSIKPLDLSWWSEAVKPDLTKDSLSKTKTK
jgi:hypothetical protein